MSALKPCPCCGEPAFRHDSRFEGTIRIECAECQMNTGECPDEEVALAIWNYRIADLPQLGPCTLCGERGKLWEMASDLGGGWRASCRECFAITKPAAGPKGAATAWGHGEVFHDD